MSAVYLKITSWAGTSIGAIHFYGELRARNPYRCVELSNTLTVASAKRLNRHRRDDFRGEDWNYRAGMKVNGFDTEQEIIDLAIKTYKTHFPEGTVLILGDPVYAEPQKIIDGPKSAIKKADKLRAKYEECGEERNWRMSDSICDEWDKLLESAK